MRQVDSRFSVSGQIGLEDIETLAASGVEIVICNRPDAEELGQPAMSEIRQAAERVGIAFVAAPFQGRPTEPAIKAVEDALQGTSRIHAYCRSGTRSAATWALAEVRHGRAVDEVLMQARNAGYDLTGLFV